MLILFFICGSFVAGFSSVWASDYVENSWSTKASMNQARSGMGVIAVEGKIYAIGGHRTFDDFLRPTDFVGTNERYDPKTDTWVTLEPMPTARHNFAIAEYQGKIYCIGGYIVDGSRWITYDVVEVYNPNSNSWSTKAALPFAEAGLTACVVDGKIYVFTSYPGSPVNSGSPVFMYNPVTDSWTAKTHMPNTTLHYYAPVVVDNKIVFTSLYLTSEIYDPATNEWTEIRKESPLILIFNSVFATQTTTGVYAPQRIYVLGRQYGTTYLTNWSYDSNGTQVSNKGTPIFRENFGVAIVDDILYVIGGTSYKYTKSNTEAEVLAVNEQYVPMGYYGALSSDMFDSLSRSNIISAMNLIVIVLIVRLVLIIGIIVIVVSSVAIGLVFYFKKRQKRTERKIIR